MIIIPFDVARRQLEIAERGCAVCTTKVLPLKVPALPLASMSTIMRPTDKVLLLRLSDRLADYAKRGKASKRVRARAQILWYVLRNGSYDLGLVEREQGIPFLYYRNAFISVKRLCEPSTRNYI